MRGPLSCLLPLVAVLLAPLAAQAAPSAIYAFGDSLSDRKNLFLLTGNGGPGGIPQPPYADGRFSNGPVWVEYLAGQLGTPPIVASNEMRPSSQPGTDFATGGATTGTSQPFGLQAQVGLYATSGFFPPAPAGALFTVWAGANDVIGALSAAPSLASLAAQQAAANVVTAAETLVTKGGATELLFVGLPDLGDTPRYRNTAKETLATDASIAFNTALAALIAGSSTLGGVVVHTLDVFSLLRSVLADPASYGFANATDPCVTGSLAAPGTPCAPDLDGQNRYVFWDDIHPTTAAHAIIAAAALAAIPEPASLLVFGLALGGLSLVQRRRAAAPGAGAR